MAQSVVEIGFPVSPELEIRIYTGSGIRPLTTIARATGPTSTTTEITTGSSSGTAGRRWLQPRDRVRTPTGFAGEFRAGPVQPAAGIHRGDPEGGAQQGHTTSAGGLRHTCSAMLGSQRRVSGRLGAERATFYGGDRVAFGTTGRVEFSPRFSLEPSLSQNWFDLREVRFTARLATARAHLHSILRGAP